MQRVQIVMWSRFLSPSPRIVGSFFSLAEISPVHLKREISIHITRAKIIIAWYLAPSYFHLRIFHVIEHDATARVDAIFHVLIFIRSRSLFLSLSLLILCTLSLPHICTSSSSVHLFVQLTSPCVLILLFFFLYESRGERRNSRRAVSRTHITQYFWIGKNLSRPNFYLLTHVGTTLTL